MTKYTVKAEVNNVIQNDDGTFDYNQKVVSMKWNEYSDRKKFHLSGRHPSEWIHAPYDGRIDNPPHGVGYDPDDLKPIKRSRTTPLTKAEIEYRHEQLKKDHEGYEYASDRDGISTHKD